MAANEHNCHMSIDVNEVLGLGWIGYGVRSPRRSQRVGQPKQEGPEGARLKIGQASKDACAVIAACVVF